MSQSSGLIMPPVWRQARWRILALLFFVTVVNFVDRLTLSFVAPVLRDTFQLSNADYGVIVSGFVLGMMVGELPMGMLMDRKGVRFGLSFAVVWWSVANALHALGRSKLEFSLLRFWMGTGECGNYSGGVKVVGEWFPARERAFAIGVFNGASLVGSMITPLLVVPIMTHLGWQAAFLIPSLLGMTWVFFWRAWYRTPESHPKLTEAEWRYISQDNEPREAAAASNRELLRLRQTWAVMLCRLLVGPVIQFYLFWLPEYLFRSRGLSLTSIALFAWLPPVFGDVGSVGGGWLTGWLMGRGLTAEQARKAVMWGGASCCALSVLVATAGSPWVWMGAICLVYLGHYALSANMFAVVSDVFPNSAVARVTGLTGIAGGLSGFLFPLLVGRVVDRLSFAPVFLMAALMPAAGVLVLFLLLGRLTKLSVVGGQSSVATDD